MRVLRSSFYSNPNRPPTIAIVPDGEARDTLEGLAYSTIETMAPHGLVINDIFEMENGDEAAASLKAAERSHQFGEAERHQVTLYFWTIQQWQMIRRGGAMASDQPAPLSVEQITTVLEQLAKRPDYPDITYSIPAQDGTIVTLSHGTVS